MKIIITNKQHKLIVEALGVPDSILEAAEEFFDIFADKIRTITDKRKEYDFQGNVDIVLGSKPKIKIDEYNLEVSVNNLKDFNTTAKISSMGMGQNFKFDREIYMKRIEKTMKAEFLIDYVVGDDWNIEELYNEFISNKEEYVSSLAHELKHFYDKQVKPIDLIGKDAEYQSIFDSPRFGIPVIDNEFLRYIYYTDVIENLVRPTEVASNIRSRKIKKSQFMEFLRQNNTYTNLLEIKDFTYEKLIEGFYNKMDRIDEILKKIGEYSSSMSSEEKIDIMFRLVYINLGNSKMKIFNKFTEDRSFNSLLSFMGISDEIEDERMDDIRSQFIKHISKYINNPKQFFKDEIKNFHIVADKMIRKIAKLYSIAEDDKPSVKESIIDWELHSKLMKQKYGKIQFETEFKENKSQFF
jgi:hypothetical protein